MYVSASATVIRLFLGVSRCRQGIADGSGLRAAPSTPAGRLNAFTVGFGAT